MAVLMMRTLAVIGGAGLLLMMFHITTDVLGRLIFGHPLFGTTEIVSNYYMVAVIFLPLAYMTRRDGHMSVELFTQKLSPRRLAILEAIVGAVTTCMLLWFAYECTIAALEATALNEKAEAGADLLIIWPTRWLLPFGLGALALQQIIKFIADIRTVFNGDESGGDAH